MFSGGSDGDSIIQKKVPPLEQEHLFYASSQAHNPYKGLEYMMCLKNRIPRSAQAHRLTCRLSTSKQGFSGVLIRLSFLNWLQARVPHRFIHWVGGINILNMGGYRTEGLQQTGPGWIRSGGIKSEIRNLAALLHPVFLTVGKSGGLTIVRNLWEGESPH